MKTDIGHTAHIEPLTGQHDLKALLDGPPFFIELLPVAAYACDAAGRVLWFNKRAADLWGRAPRVGDDTEVFCGSHKLYFGGRQITRDETPMAMAIRTGEAIHGAEGIMERPDGSRVWVTVHIEPAKDATGNVLGAINCFHDTTDLHQARADVAEREARTRRILDALPGAVYTTDHAGRITYYNEAAVKLAGREPRLGSDEWCVTWRLYHPDGRPMPHDECPMAVALKEDRPIRGVEAIAERPDGTRVPFIPYPTPLHDDSGMLVGAVNMLVDISERKRAEETAQWLAAVVNSSLDAIVSKDLNGIIKSWNSGAERLFGYTTGEAIGKSVTMLVPPDRLDEEPEILRRIRRGEQVDHFETVRMCKDGSLLDVSLTISPIKDVNGNIIGASKLARDISQHKQAQARQELLTREIQHRTKNLFAVVQAVVGRSFVDKRTVKDAESAVLSRLSSLAQTHMALIDTQWEGADFRGLVETEMSPFAGRVRIEGPKVMLNAKAAQNFGLAVHELATNAAKYGALSNSTGQVDIRWSVGKPNGSAAFSFQWQELGGPPVERPKRKGFGSIVLERIMGEYFPEPPRIDFAPSGVRYELNTSLDARTDVDPKSPRGDLARLGSTGGYIPKRSPDDFRRY